MSPATAYESFGIEDPRITFLDGRHWINYTAVSPLGITTGLASTRDFKSFERHGLIFSPPNRDVTIFPEKIRGQYVALHRPMPEGLGKSLKKQDLRNLVEFLASLKEPPADAAGK